MFPCIALISLFFAVAIISLVYFNSCLFKKKLTFTQCIKSAALGYCKIAKYVKQVYF